MIKNRRQLRTTQKWVRHFQEAYDTFDPLIVEANVHPIIRQAQKDAIFYKLSDLKKQVREYLRKRPRKLKF